MKKGERDVAAYLDRDGLVKSMLEDLIKEAILMMIPSADRLFDFRYKVAFLDKELRPLALGRRKKGKREADLVVKVRLKDGTSRIMILLFEVQGYYDKNFAERMFTQYYRLWDKYRLPVICLALYTSADPGFSPSMFKQGNVHTWLEFHFCAYKLTELSDEELVNHSSLYAIALRIMRLSLQQGKVPDEVMMRQAVSLAEELGRRNISVHKKMAVFSFLRNYVRFSDEQNLVTFEKEIDGIINKAKTMGVIEYVTRAKILEARDVTKRETKEEVVRNLLKKQYPDKEIAEVVNVSLAFIQKVKKRGY